jgi:MoCo/4Fe-4S cofactor protein with predicted Tat translocation signal
MNAKKCRVVASGEGGRRTSNAERRAPNAERQWGSLEQLASDPEFQVWLHREFPAAASEFSDPLARREFLRLMVASFALMGLGACTRPPPQKIVPYLEQPELLVSGRPLFFATAMPFNGSATGILVESNEGRPTKIEGNPSHPLSLGATSIFEQAAILSLYDSDRSKTLVRDQRIETWETFISDWLKEQTEQLKGGGSSLRFLLDTVVSPTVVGQIDQLRKRFPRAKWHQWDPISRASIVEAYRPIFGQAAEPELDLSQADVVVAFDSDFLFESPFRLSYARKFANRRNYKSSGFAHPNYLYVVEPSPTITGSMGSPASADRAGDWECGLPARRAPWNRLERRYPQQRAEKLDRDLRCKAGSQPRRLRSCSSAGYFSRLPSPVFFTQRTLIRRQSTLTWWQDPSIQESCLPVALRQRWRFPLSSETGGCRRLDCSCSRLHLDRYSWLSKVTNTTRSG